MPAATVSTGPEQSRTRDRPQERLRQQPESRAPDQAYVTEIDYQWNYYKELSPAWLAAICTLHGVRPPDLTGPFRYCELGCGRPLSLAAHAALYPTGQFVGIDFSRDAMDAAAVLMTDRPADNFSFRRQTFEDAAGRTGEAPFDFICLHGVLSWVDATQRAHIRRFIDAHLAPGGLVYASYNCHPGWSAYAPLRRLLKLFADRVDGPLIARIEYAYRSLKALVAANPAMAETQGPALEQLGKDLKRPLYYVAHEYFNECWEIFHSADVIADFAGIGIDFVGSTWPGEMTRSTRILEQIAAERPAAGEAAAIEAGLVETAADIALNRRFRADLFCRAPTRLAETDADAAFDALPFYASLASAEPDNGPEANDPAPMAEATGLPEQTVRAVIARATAAPLSARELAAEGVPADSAAEATALSRIQARDLLTVLWLANLIEPANPLATVAGGTDADDGSPDAAPASDLAARCRQFNAALSANPLHTPIAWLLSPCLGQPIAVAEPERWPILTTLHNHGIEAAAVAAADTVDDTVLAYLRASGVLVGRG